MFSSMQDWLIIGAIVAVLFGGRKLPDVGRGLGEGIREFKKATLGQHDEENKELPAKTEETQSES